MTINVFHTIEGTGKPVVLISGLGGRASFWDEVKKELLGRYQIITLDHPGVGQSPIIGDPNISGIAEAVIEILDHYKIPSAHILGHSTGSLVTQCLALDYADRVKSIVLSSGWAKPDQRFIDFFTYRKETLAVMGEHAYNELTRYIAYPSEYYEYHFKKESGVVSTDSPNKEMILKRIDMLLSYSRLEELNSIQHSALVIGANDDYVIPFLHSKQLFQAISNAQLVELSGGHFTPKVKPAAYAEIVNKFWESM